MDRCKYCHEPLSAGMSFCPACGKKIEPVYVQAEFEIEAPVEKASEARKAPEPPKAQESPKSFEPPKAAPAQPAFRDREEEQPPFRPPVKNKKGRKIFFWILLIILFISAIGQVFLVPKIKSDNKTETPKATAKLTVRPAANAVETVTPMVLATLEALNSRTEKPAEIPAEAAGNSAAEDECPIVSILANYNTVFGVRRVGTIAATGTSLNAAMDFSDWTGVVAIASDEPSRYLAGLRGDGTVLFTGEGDPSAVREIRSWSNIVRITAFYNNILVAVRADGTVTGTDLYSGPAAFDNEYGTEIRQWKNIADLYYAGNVLFGKRKDGSWVNTQPDGYRLWLQWYGDAVSFCDYDKIALFPDGHVKVVSACVYYDLSGWTDISKVETMQGAVFGLRKDGTVLAVQTSRNHSDSYQDIIDEVRSWRDIVDLSAATTRVVGLKKDGSLVFAGDSNWFNDLSDWNTQRAAAEFVPRIFPYPGVISVSDFNARQDALAMVQDMYKQSVKSGSVIDRCRYGWQLNRAGYTDEDAWFALEHAGIDWRKCALEFAQKLHGDMKDPVSRNWLVNDLREYGFSDDEIRYAESHWTLDFNQMALKEAQKYIDSGRDAPYDYKKIIDHLEGVYYTHEQAVYAAERTGYQP